MKKFLLLFFVVLFFTSSLPAREGMWVPLLLRKYNLAEMQQMGFQLSAADIYAVNNASMKDAVALFGRGCTAGLISDRGLLITNHHCGYRYIQEHSTVDKDYLTDGFWAMEPSEELPNPGLTVRFLESMEDVTAQVLAGTRDLPGEEREKQIRENRTRIEKEASRDETVLARVKPLFYGNQYFLYVYKVFRDVRLVGAPPSSIGKFGGDTDNWMWPRHTGDFSLFRIYADENNEPADYSSENVPYRPEKFFPVSTEGIHPGDFTLVLGYPGSTRQYIPSQELDLILNQRNPDRIRIRDKKLEVLREAMASDPEIRLQYAAKYAGISNSWKRWQGEILGLERHDALAKKRAFEDGFMEQAKKTGTWQKEYRPVFESFEKTYAVYDDFIRASDYYSEILMGGVELFRVAARMNALINCIENDSDKQAEIFRKSIAGFLPGFFKNYDSSVDEQLFQKLLPLLRRDLNEAFLPGSFIELMDRHGDQSGRKIYRKSILPKRDQMEELLEKGSDRQLRRLRKDPFISLYDALSYHHEALIRPVVDSLEQELDKNMKTYMAGIMEMEKGTPLYPDANHTFRVAYGKVKGYEPRDGVRYQYSTTLQGIMEKAHPDIYDYQVPDRLRQLYSEKNYGRYGEGDHMPVCFIASNHTTGGNSGSPVLNGRGELIGVNFDRCWEGTMSDLMYAPEVSRNIVLDIRYALFIIDKFAGAGYLLREMDIADGAGADAKN